MDRRLLGLFSLLAAAGLFLLACDLTTVVASKPSVSIVSPSNGLVVQEGDIVSVRSVSTDSAGITRVELGVDGTVVRTDPVPGGSVSFSITQTWRAISGTHTISVQAYSLANVASDAEKIRVKVLPGSASGNPLSTPSASITGTGSISCTPSSSFVSDVTVPDGTLLASGQTFNKIWQVRNVGTCAWGADYQLVFASGEAMTTTLSIPLPPTDPGATADVLLSMVAPATPGTHTSFWRLKGPNGNLFGSLSVEIQVQAPPVPDVTNTPPPAVTPVPIVCSGTPNIASFGISPTTISFGQSAVLSWGFVSNADSAEIDQQIGGVATPGSTVVTPTTTTTYKITARCGNATISKQTTVQVINPGFAVTGVTAGVTPLSAVTCPAAFTFSGMITANGAGTATYRWERSDGTSTPTQAVTFGDAGTLTVTNPWNVGVAGSGWAELHVLSPNNLVSAQASFSLTCTESFQVSNIIVDASPVTFTAKCPAVFSLTGEITANGPGAVTYRWDKSDGSSSADQTITFAGLGSQTVSTQWSGPPTGAGWAKLHILTPKEVVSSPANFTNGCQ